MMQFEGPDAPLAVRTDEARFERLSGYPFTANYLDLPTKLGETVLRMHYVDEGPADAPVVLMVHGEPSWSYLYRHLIPVFAQAGLRAVAPDLIGFGRSDKPVWGPHYSFASHAAWLEELVLGLDLRRITLVCQDWGGPLALAVLARHPARFARVVAANTMLHTVESALRDRLDWAAHSDDRGNVTLNDMLLAWVTHGVRSIAFDASTALQGSTVTDLPQDVLDAYDAPFPTEWHKAGMRHFSTLIPLSPHDPGVAINRATWDALAGFEKPFLTLFSDGDPATRGWEALFRERVPGARGQPHQVLTGAGHFWQEDVGAAAAALICDWIRATPSTD